MNSIQARKLITKIIVKGFFLSLSFVAFYLALDFYQTGIIDMRGAYADSKESPLEFFFLLLLVVWFGWRFFYWSITIGNGDKSKNNEINHQN